MRASGPVTRSGRDGRTSPSVAPEKEAVPVGPAVSGEVAVVLVEVPDRVREEEHLADTSSHSTISRNKPVARLHNA